jgi:hypothetical protein
MQVVSTLYQSKAETTKYFVCFHLYHYQDEKKIMWGFKSYVCVFVTYACYNEVTPTLIDERMK